MAATAVVDATDRPDPHSYWNPDQPTITHLDWEANVDFESQTITGCARLKLDQPGELIDLDTRDLQIERVFDDGGQDLGYSIDPEHAVLGQRLRINLQPHQTIITITYRTVPTASALQWLTATQARSRLALVYSQCQLLNARSLFPCQDTPSVRFTYRARLTVPHGFRGVMAATKHGRSRSTKEGTTTTWRMEQSIPSYLVAFAVGELVKIDVTRRCRVWALPSVVQRAADEFKPIGKLIAAAERLFGPYPWGKRFDILVMPASFPYGGMENPTLTFITMGVLVGDRSMIEVVAHELAHAWFGNSITNATWADFWLNEGWTVWAHLRIIEAVYGREAALLQAALLLGEYHEHAKHFADRPELTHLQVPITADDDPDLLVSRVPYVKGYLFLRLLEETVGREAFDRFVRRYLARYRFSSIDTGDFLSFFHEVFPGDLDEVQFYSWINGPWLPRTCPSVMTEQLRFIMELAHNRLLPSESVRTSWGGSAWTLYLQQLPRDAQDICQRLNDEFAFSRHPNPELRFEWFQLLMRNNGEMTPKICADLSAFLTETGRKKYLQPLYGALKARGADGLVFARATFSEARSGYHPLTDALIAQLLELGEAVPA